MKLSSRPAIVISALLVIATASTAMGLAAGSSGWGFAAPNIVWQIRLPRVLAGLGAGAALALSATLMRLDVQRAG